VSESETANQPTERLALRWERRTGESPAITGLSDHAVTIGRGCDNTIVIDSESASTTHAQLEFNGVCHVLTDLDSAGGTRLNGSVVTSAVVVEAGDVIQIGGEHLQVVDATAASPEPEHRVPWPTLRFRSVAAISIAASAALIVVFFMWTAPRRSMAGPSPGPRTSDSVEPEPVTALGDRANRSIDISIAAGAVGVAAADALADEAMVQSRAGRFLDAEKLFAAALELDPASVLIRTRLQSTRLARTEQIVTYMRAAERAASGLRFEDAERQWEQVLLLVDASDERGARAEAALAHLRSLKKVRDR
jgi:pSer/pThr/pTyr-binding forkhead associated (FHA) protein